jgi:hypothetical protein
MYYVSQLKSALANVAIQPQGQSKLDILPWVRRVTLDIIGQAGFDYNFDSLANIDPPGELHRLLDTIFQPSKAIAAWIMLGSVFPLLRVIVSALSNFA